MVARRPLVLAFLIAVSLFSGVSPASAGGPCPNDDLCVATSAALPNVMIVRPRDSFNPVYSLDGRAWRSFATVPWRDANTLPQIALVPRGDPLAPVRFLAAVSSPGYPDARPDLIGVYRTGDYGANWVRYLPPPGWCNTADRYFRYLTASPANPQRLYLEHLCYADNPSGSTHFSTLYTSADGITWEALDLMWLELAFSPVLPERVYSLWGGWRVSDDGGVTNRPVDFPVDRLEPDWTDAARLYGVGIHRQSAVAVEYTGKSSTDAGATWRDWTEQPCPTTFKQLLALPVPANALLLRCEDGIHRSIDGGSSWTKIAIRPGGMLWVDYGVRNRVLWTRDNDLWASTDAGSTWTRIGNWGMERVYLPVMLR